MPVLDFIFIVLNASLHEESDYIVGFCRRSTLLLNFEDFERLFFASYRRCVSHCVSAFIALLTAGALYVSHYSVVYNVNEAPSYVGRCA